MAETRRNARGTLTDPGRPPPLSLRKVQLRTFARETIRPGTDAAAHMLPPCPEPSSPERAADSGSAIARRARRARLPGGGHRHRRRGRRARRRARSATGAWGSRLDVTDAEACRVAAAAGRRARPARSTSGSTTPASSSRASSTSRSPRPTGDARGERGRHLQRDPGRARTDARRPAAATSINVVSLAGLVAAPGEVAYAASKHAAIAFTLGTLADLRRSGIKGIDVSAVCPDGVWTRCSRTSSTTPTPPPPSRARC